MSTSVLSIVQTYQKKINHCQDAAKLLYYINKLYKLPVKVEHLQETGIGKTVNSLRKYNGEIGVAAKALVSKWKAMVAAEEDLGEKMEIDANHEQRAASVDNEINQSQHTQAVAAPSKHDSHKEQSSRRENGRHSSSRMEKELRGDSSEQRESSRHHADKTKREKHHSSRERTEERHKEKHSEHHRDRKKEENGPAKEGDSKIAEAAEETKEMPSTSHHRGEHKSSSSSSSKRKRESSNEENRHHSSRDREKSKSSKDKEKDKEKSRKEDHKSTSSKKSSSSSHSTSSKSTNSNAAPSTSSSSGHKKDRHSNDKAEKETKPPKAERATKVRKTSIAAEEAADNGIDSSMGANFEDVLGMLNVPTKKMKKPVNCFNITSPTKGDVSTRGSSAKSSSNIVIDNERPSTSGMSGKISLKSKPELLRPSVKLEPLDPSIALELPTISTNYKPMPLNLTVMDCVFNTSNSSASKPSARTLSDADALHHGISSKTMRTKIYSGVRTGQIMQVPSLFDLCTRFLQKNIDALEFTGGVPFDILRPVLERATPNQLFMFEEYNPYVLDDTDELWKHHVQRNYRTQQRQEMETWREMFLRCQDDQERKLNTLAETIKQSQKQIAAPIRKTQMAFVDSFVKPPRNVLRKQEQYGTKAKLVATPAARVAALSSVAPNATKSGDIRLRAIGTSTRDPAQVSHSAVRPKKGPLMAKALQLMRGRQRR